MLRNIICLVRGNDRLTVIILLPVTGESYSFLSERRDTSFKLFFNLLAYEQEYD